MQNTIEYDNFFFKDDDASAGALRMPPDRNERSPFGLPGPSRLLEGRSPVAAGGRFLAPVFESGRAVGRTRRTTASVWELPLEALYRKVLARSRDSLRLQSCPPPCFLWLCRS